MYKWQKFKDYGNKMLCTSQVKFLNEAYVLDFTCVWVYFLKSHVCKHVICVVSDKFEVILGCKTVWLIMIKTRTGPTNKHSRALDRE